MSVRISSDLNPYYADEWVTLFRADARAGLQQVFEPCAIVTDPPWGTGWVRGGGAMGEFVHKHERAEWDVWSTDWMAFSGFVKAGAVFSPPGKAEEVRRVVGKAASTVYWRKTNPRPNGPDRDAITVWPLFLPDGIEFESYNGDTPLHPCQKPLDLMQWVLQFVDPQLTIVDPFAGSGTTLEAAKKLGRRAIGIEQDEAYCQIAADRFAQTVLNLDGAA